MTRRYLTAIFRINLVSPIFYTTKRFVAYSKHHKALCGLFKTPQSALWPIQNTTKRFMAYSKHHKALEVGRGVYRRVLLLPFSPLRTRIPNAPRIVEMLTKYKERHKMVRETMFRTMMHNPHKCTSLKLSRKVFFNLSTSIRPFLARG